MSDDHIVYPASQDHIMLHGDFVKRSGERSDAYGMVECTSHCYHRTRARSMKHYRLGLQVQACCHCGVFRHLLPKDYSKQEGEHGPFKP